LRPADEGRGGWRRSLASGDGDGVVLGLPEPNQDDEDVRATEGEGEEQKRAAERPEVTEIRSSSSQQWQKPASNSAA
jgi:hypothetical protein